MGQTMTARHFAANTASTVVVSNVAATRRSAAASFSRSIQASGTG